MKIVIVGCGKIGTSIIDSMATENHDITAVDNDMQVIQSVTDCYDVIAVCGNATSRQLLVNAGVAKADLFIAVTQSDEVNMLSCFLAKKMGAKHTVARVRSADYNEEGMHELIMDLDLSMTLNPERLTADALFNILKLPSAINVDTFAGKKVQILEMIIRNDSTLDGAVLSDLRKKCPVQFIACAVRRGEEVFIPTGTFALQLGDKVAFMVKSSDAHKFLKTVGMVKKHSKDVILLGGSTIAYYLAKTLCANNYFVKIVDKDAERCATLAEQLPSNTAIIIGDGTNQELLREEDIAGTDAFVALTGRDEENILVSFYALSQKVPKVITKVNNLELLALAEKLGLDSVVSPRRIVADVVTRYARALNDSMGSKVETMYRLVDGSAEALEFAVLPDCPVIGIPLKQLDLIPNCIVAGIIRGKETLIPSGDDSIEQGDRVIVVAADVRLSDLSDIVR